METSAVYWEPRIKTYGFQVETGLTLLDIGLTPQQWTDTCDRLRELDAEGASFLLVLVQPGDDGEIHVVLLVEDRHRMKLLETAKGIFPQEQEDAMLVIFPAEMIHFQGPHFAERYGILDTAFRALSQGGVPLLAAACTGASITLVLPEGKSGTAKTLLEDAFEIPTGSVRMRHLSGRQTRSRT